jgi:hypothetical protein
MLGIRRAQAQNGHEQPDNSVIPLLERRIAHLETALKLMDVDLQDAINGFYRRRQADRMQEIRQDDAKKKEPRRRLTDGELVRAALRMSDSSDTKSDGTE